jgi:hypothetical protein
MVQLLVSRERQNLAHLGSTKTSIVDKVLSICDYYRTAEEFAQPTPMVKI